MGQPLSNPLPRLAFDRSLDSLAGGMTPIRLQAHPFRACSPGGRLDVWQPANAPRRGVSIPNPAWRTCVRNTFIAVQTDLSRVLCHWQAGVASTTLWTMLLLTILLTVLHQYLLQLRLAGSA